MTSNDLSLANLIGKDIFIKIPEWKGTELCKVKLVGVETGGIWFESADFMESMFEGTQHKMTEKSVAIFLPYGQILGIYYFGWGGPWISEKVAQ